MTKGGCFYENRTDPFYNYPSINLLLFKSKNPICSINIEYSSGHFTDYLRNDFINFCLSSHC